MLPTAIPIPTSAIRRQSLGKVQHTHPMPSKGQTGKRARNIRGTFSIATDAKVDVKLRKGQGLGENFHKINEMLNGCSPRVSPKALAVSTACKGCLSFKRAAATFDQRPKRRYALKSTGGGFPPQALRARSPLGGQEKRLDSQNLRFEH